jgi:hypothetical protein
MEPAMRRVMRGALGGAALLVLLALGCGRDASAPPTRAAEPEIAAQPKPDAVVDEPLPDAVAPPGVPPGDAHATAHAEEPEPPALPADVPLYASALPISSMSSPARGTIVNLRSKDAVELVSAWYAKELPAHGWALETQSGAANSQLLTAVKQARRASVLITGNERGTQILLTVLETH